MVAAVDDLVERVIGRRVGQRRAGEGESPDGEGAAEPVAPRDRRHVHVLQARPARRPRQQRLSGKSCRRDGDSPAATIAAAD